MYDYITYSNNEKTTFTTDSGSQRQLNKCIKTYFSVPQQGVPSNAIFMSTYVLKDKKFNNGSHPLLLLGPNTPAEASSVLQVVRLYNKLMVRNEITKIIVPRQDL